MLKTIDHNGHAVHILQHGRDVFICAKDLIDAANLTGKANPSMIAKKAGAAATIRLKRSSFPDAFGKIGCAFILFLSLDALDKWARPYPDGEAAKALQVIRDAFWRPFGTAQ